MWPLKLKYVVLSSSSTKINIIYKSYGTTRAATASHQKYRLTPLPSAEKSVFFRGYTSASAVVHFSTFYSVSNEKM